MNSLFVLVVQSPLFISLDYGCKFYILVLLGIKSQVSICAFGTRSAFTLCNQWQRTSHEENVYQSCVLTHMYTQHM